METRARQSLLVAIECPKMLGKLQAVAGSSRAEGLPASPASHGVFLTCDTMPLETKPIRAQVLKKKKYKPCTVRGNLRVSHSAPGRDSPGPPPGRVQQSHADTEGYGGESL